MTDYPMCPTCRRADVEVMMAKDVRDPCPHCGGVLMESLRVCCLPDCEQLLAVTEPAPVCEACGIKIALIFAPKAARHDPAHNERQREEKAREAERQASRAATSVVYYVQLDATRIKIGYTSNLRSRLAALRAHPSALLAVEPGGRDVEKSRHDQFDVERLDRKLEEFFPSGRLLAWVSEMRKLHAVPAWANVPDTRVQVRRA